MHLCLELRGLLTVAEAHTPNLRAGGRGTSKTPLTNEPVQIFFVCVFVVVVGHSSTFICLSKTVVQREIYYQSETDCKDLLYTNIKYKWYLHLGSEWYSISTVLVPGTPGVC